MARMHMYFIDESGTAPNKPGRNRHFVVGGVVIPEAQWHDLRAELVSLKREKKIHGEIKWRYFYQGNMDDQNPMKHLWPAEIEEVRTRCYKMIAARKAIKIICCVTDIEAAFKSPNINTADELYFATYKPVTERFQYHLQGITRESGSRENGIIICDHRGSKSDSRLRILHERMVRGNQLHTSDYKNLVEGVFLSPSHHGVGIQFADLVVGAVYRFFEKNDRTFFDQIESSIRKNPATGSYKGWGLVRYPYNAT